MRKYFRELKTPFHIYNRGTEKRIIFTEYAEYCRFIFLMWACRIGSPAINLSRHNVIEAAEAILHGKKPNHRLYAKEHSPLVTFVTWNLLPNHFHFILISLVEGGIAKYMGKLANAYTKYFNTRHQRSGRLFQNPYQSIEIRDSRYLYTLIRYINLNHAELVEPQWKERRIGDQDKMREFVDSYQWTAHQDYLGVRHSLLIDGRVVEKLLEGKFTGEEPREYQQFIDQWVTEDFELIKKYIFE